MRILWSRSGRSATSVAVAALCVAAGLATAATPSVAQSISQNTVVGANPQDNTPRLPLGTSAQFVARAYLQLGATTYVGGTFPTINGVPRTNLAAFNTTTGALTSFAPRLDGVVNAITPSPDGNIFVGGTFTTVNGIARRGVVKLTPAGAVVTQFNGGYPSGAVFDLQMTRGRLVVAGSIPRKLVAVDPVTGKDTLYITVAVTGSIGTAAGTERVDKFEANPAGTRLVALGNFTTVAGKARRGAFMLNLGPSTTALSPWYSTRFNETCAPGIPYYLRDVDFNPDGSRFALVTTGTAFPQSNPANRRKLCDSASMWNSSGLSSTDEPVWINYTGGDSLYAVRVTNAAVYVGGHIRWLNNPNGNNTKGGCVGAVCPVDRAGLGALNPTTGLALTWNPQRKIRGHGVEVLLLTTTGLWVGGDTMAPGAAGCSTPLPGGNCAGQTLEVHPGIVFFPL